MKLLDKLNILLIVLAGIGFLIFGAYLFVSPLDGLARFGLSLPGDAVHRIEMRAFYGGLEIGLGLLLLKFAASSELRRAGLWLVLASYGGLGVARACAMIMDGFSNQIFIIALALELFFGICAALALMRRG